MTERHEAVRYFVEQDMMAIEIRPWPGKPGEHGEGRISIAIMSCSTK